MNPETNACAKKYDVTDECPLGFYECGTDGTLRRYGGFFPAVSVPSEIPDKAPVDPASCPTVRSVVYVPAWVTTRGHGRAFFPEHLDASLTTHPVLAFAEMQEAPYRVAATNNVELQVMKRFIRHVRLTNGCARPMLAVGGWHMGATPSLRHRWSTMTGSATNRETFTASAISFMRQHGFEGMDLNWEFPAYAPQGGRPEDKENFVELVKHMRAEFRAEAEASGLPEMVLTITAANNPNQIIKGYDMAGLEPHIDWVNMMTYDYHGHWDPVTLSQTAMRDVAPDGVAGSYILETVETWKAYGMPAEKLTLGLASYGRSWTIQWHLEGRPIEELGMNTPAAGAGTAGPVTLTPGFLAYYEITDLCTIDNIADCNTALPQGQIAYDEETETAYGVWGTTWVGFDDVRAIRAKCEFAKSENLAGVMMWSADFDDFLNGFPLMTEMYTSILPPSPSPSPSPSAASPSPTPSAAEGTIPGVAPSPSPAFRYVGVEVSGRMPDVDDMNALSAVTTGSNEETRTAIAAGVAGLLPVFVDAKDVAVAAFTTDALSTRRLGAPSGRRLEAFLFNLKLVVAVAAHDQAMVAQDWARATGFRTGVETVLGDSLDTLVAVDTVMAEATVSRPFVKSDSGEESTPFYENKGVQYGAFALAGILAITGMCFTRSLIKKRQEEHAKEAGLKPTKRRSIAQIRKGMSQVMPSSSGDLLSQYTSHTAVSRVTRKQRLRALKRAVTAKSQRRRIKDVNQLNLLARLHQQEALTAVRNQQKRAVETEVTSPSMVLRKDPATGAAVPVPMPRFPALEAAEAEEQRRLLEEQEREYQSTLMNERMTELGHNEDAAVSDTSSQSEAKADQVDADVVSEPGSAVSGDNAGAPPVPVETEVTVLSPQAMDDPDYNAAKDLDLSSSSTPVPSSPKDDGDDVVDEAEDLVAQMAAEAAGEEALLAPGLEDVPLDDVPLDDDITAEDMAPVPEAQQHPYAGK